MESGSSFACQKKFLSVSVCQIANQREGAPVLCSWSVCVLCQLDWLEIPVCKIIFHGYWGWGGDAPAVVNGIQENNKR